jgi:diacylglycerol kinase (ATP)
MIIKNDFVHSFNNNRTIFLINPKAGIIPDSILINYLKKFSSEFDYAAFPTIGEFREFMKTSINNYDVFIAVGGDGTVNGLATELAGTGKILGVFPIGSGNGFAREMGFLPLIKNLVKDIRKKEFFDIDVLYINDHPCVNVFGIGIDSLVAHEFHNLNHRGIFNYGVAAFKVVGKIKPFKVTVSFGDERFTDEYFMVSVANTRQFGNNAYLAPMAKPDDGKYNLVLLKPFPKYMLPVIVIRMQTKTLKDSKYLKYHELDLPLTIRSEEHRIHIDGDPGIDENEISVRIKKNDLRVLKSSFRKIH